jgi:RHS repeat-associated protein
VLVATYLYDAFGRRVEKIVAGSGNLNGTTRYHLDGRSEIEQRNGAGNLTQQYVYGSGINQPLLLDRNTGGGATATGPGDRRLFYNQDAQGSIVGLTNTSGKLVEGHLYDAYGRQTVFDPRGSGVIHWGGRDVVTPGGSSRLGNPFMYTGQRLDPETGLYYYHARYMDPVLGRFLSMDPIGGWTDGANLGNGYGYAGNGPAAGIDPLGLEDTAAPAYSPVELETPAFTEFMAKTEGYWEGVGQGVLDAAFMVETNAPEPSPSQPLLSGILAGPEEAPNLYGRQSYESARSFGMKVGNVAYAAKTLLEAAPSLWKATKGWLGSLLKVSITALGQTGGHTDSTMPSMCWARRHPQRWPECPANRPEGMRQRVREILRVGADWIKVCSTGEVLSSADSPASSQFTVEELEAAVDEGRAHGDVEVMAHAQGTRGIKNAIRAGIKSIEHGIWLDEEAIEMMKARSLYLVPTLVAPVQVIRRAEANPGSIPELYVQKARDVVSDHRASFTRAVHAGVKVAMGTDSGVGPHGENAEELELMVKGGMTPMEAILATTAAGAKLLKVDRDLGTIENGKLADLIIVDGDPIKDIPVLRDPKRIVLVMQAGKILKNLIPERLLG